jgi:ribosomal protein S18 acetylase RimI-like enzyme
VAVEIRNVGADALERWGDVPISFRVESVLDARQVDGGPGGLALTERRVEKPYVKNYDSHEDEAPRRWLRFDVSHWGFFQASVGDEIVGCAAVACRSPKVHMLGGRDDIALLWDIRVRPERRRQGIGTKLFRRAVEFARAEGYSQLRIETQNVNMRACRFYAKQGCRLAEIRRNAYREPEIAHETMLVWRLDL